MPHAESCWSSDGRCIDTIAAADASDAEEALSRRHESRSAMLSLPRANYKYHFLARHRHTTAAR